MINDKQLEALKVGDILYRMDDDHIVKPSVTMLFFTISKATKNMVHCEERTGATGYRLKIPKTEIQSRYSLTAKAAAVAFERLLYERIRGFKKEISQTQAIIYLVEKVKEKIS